MKRSDNFNNRFITWLSIALAVVLCAAGITACVATPASTGTKTDSGSIVTPIDASEMPDQSSGKAEAVESESQAGGPVTIEEVSAPAPVTDTSETVSGSDAGNYARTVTGSEGSISSASELKEDEVMQSAEMNTSGNKKIRELPAASPVSTASAGTATADPLATMPLDTTKRPDSYTGPSVMFIENSAVAEKKLTYSQDFPSTQQDVNDLLLTLMDYWESYNLDAIDYLMRMDKYRYLSQLLAGSSDYFYYGPTNTSGEPNGKGIAVYAGNQYYYGNFVNGKRSGKGEWYQIFEMDGEYCMLNNGIYLHSYSGEWANDKPDGQGQEHIGIKEEYLRTRICTNVVGTFKQGYYDGKETVTTLDENGHFINWEGQAIKGAWIPVGGMVSSRTNEKPQIPILTDLEHEDSYFWIFQDENGGQGVMGLVGK